MCQVYRMSFTQLEGKERLQEEMQAEDTAYKDHLLRVLMSLTPATLVS